jgi:primary-amine oxidase
MVGILVGAGTAAQAHPLDGLTGAEMSAGSDSVAAWVQQNRPIHDTGIVTWYSLGFHHVPHMEDWPVMSTMWEGFTLMPFNFFSQNPAMTIREPS